MITIEANNFLCTPQDDYDVKTQCGVLFVQAVNNITVRPTS